MNFKLLILTAFLAHHAIQASVLSKPSKYLNKPYELILGAQNASANYQKNAIQALEDFQVADAHLVPIKKMNVKLMGKDFLSFTLFGIWINQDALDTLDPVLAQWTFYHEAAHYALNHHAKAVLINSIVPLLIAQSLYRNQSLSHIALASIGTVAYFEACFKPFMRDQEREADIAAAQVLCNVGKTEVVKRYLDRLKEEMATGCIADDWHNSLIEQHAVINYYYQLYTSKS